MTTEREKQLYELAHERALARKTERENLIPELVEAFQAGISMACGSRSDEHLRMTVNGWIKSETNYAFAFICGFLCKLEALKGKHYAASWQKRGERDGALVNLQRKIDRLEVVVSGGGTGDGETPTQTLGDSAVYSTKWIVLRAELDPEEVFNWFKEVRNL